MKKLVSIILAVMMAFLVATVASVTAFAATSVRSPESTTVTTDKTGQVNGNKSDDVTYTTDKKDPTKITFTYKGEGTVTGWEFPGMVEGQDYQIVSEDGATITIQLINNYEGKVVANALVDGLDTTTTKVANTSDSNESPNTGATVATGIALMGAGAAVLAMMKKKQDAE